MDDVRAKIEASEVFLSIFTENYKNDPACAMRLGMAIIADKPIYLLVKNGTEVPSALRSISRAVYFFEDESDVQDAARRIFKSIEERQ